jgi:hypothetical protein
MIWNDAYKSIYPFFCQIISSGLLQGEMEPAYFIHIGSTRLIGILFRKAMGPGPLFGAVLVAAGVRLAGQTQGAKS